jgi:hypothetical protein
MIPAISVENELPFNEWKKREVFIIKKVKYGQRYQMTNG